VLIDGQDTNVTQDSLRSHIGMVTQDIVAAQARCATTSPTAV
jgi:ABC-type transport system involved in Fe-S cluster assembly fused permease/ATPase subunit